VRVESKLQDILNSVTAKPGRARLEPYGELIDDLHRRGLTYHGRVRSELIPNLFDVTWHWKHDFWSDQSPENMMQPLLESYASLKKQFAGEPALLRIIDREIAQ
jgi:hypothetical protein